MSIAYQILGPPDGDNALYVQVQHKQGMERLLFDCGADCLSALAYPDLQDVDHLFFSHFHMDHVGGFDSFFRATFNRISKPNQIWGPPDAIRVLHHRFQGYTWNLLDHLVSTWRITEVHPDHLKSVYYRAKEGFSLAYEEPLQPVGEHLIHSPYFTVKALAVDHQMPALAYVVRECPRRYFQRDALKNLNLPAGPWVQDLKESIYSDTQVEIAGQTRSIAEWRKELIVEAPGDSIAYLTDFILYEDQMDSLAEQIQGCKTLVCEAQYRHADLEKARHQFHMTTVLAATLARKAQVGELILFHLSRRYERHEWLEMLDEARAIFPNTRFPDHWGLG